MNACTPAHKNNARQKKSKSSSFVKCIYVYMCIVRGANVPDTRIKTSIDIKLKIGYIDNVYITPYARRHALHVPNRDLSLQPDENDEEKKIVTESTMARVYVVRRTKEKKSHIS